MRLSDATMSVKQIFITTFLLLAVAWTTPACAFPSSGDNGSASRDDSAIARAFKEKKRNVQVEGEGVVERILADDLAGGRHQRFIVRLGSGQTLLIAHNIDLAPRVAGLQEGDRVAFYGEYIWNSQGGIVHWTHHDPQGRHVAGWLKHKGQTYQ